MHDVLWYGAGARMSYTHIVADVECRGQGWATRPCVWVGGGKDGPLGRVCGWVEAGVGH